MLDIFLSRWRGRILRREGKLVQDFPEWISQASRGCERPKETWIRTMQREVGYDDIGTSMGTSPRKYPGNGIFARFCT